MPEDLCFLQYVPEYVEAEQDCDTPAFDGSYMPAPGEFAPVKFASQSLVTGHAAAETHAGQYKVATDMPTSSSPPVASKLLLVVHNTYITVMTMLTAMHSHCTPTETHGRYWALFAVKAVLSLLVIVDSWHFARRCTTVLRDCWGVI